MCQQPKKVESQITKQNALRTYAILVAKLIPNILSLGNMAKHPLHNLLKNPLRKVMQDLLQSRLSL